ncbi:MAG: imidazole glycerol phosphate synthase subunit HisH [Methanoregulaceae archaeon PtaB.Bin009]|nr:MAG: imidazole glycerol phosphate synthase subunit HisH [Methanoregulaceae archaeon PtaB.Bin009]OPY42205.1 MAG: imidazole glycerol phosphate synthase subunit HisH [Methanoregulaceae archaeon PtaU1.Bin066]HNQ28668.1 imidazole glycerol phosphate synthase subunit HisH [Methanolinea sp.]
MKKIIIVDYGLGNLRSVRRGIEKSGGVPVISTDIHEISSAEGIVLPGVGAFRDGMQQLGDLQEVLVDISHSVPVLGICLGMQMLMEWSEEHGVHRGLGLVPGVVRRFPRREGYKIPHMGWNTLSLTAPENPLFEGIQSGEFMYFVHSYYADTQAVYTMAATEYVCPFSSVIWNRDRVFGVQFHPEKSGAAGLQLLRNFIAMV